LAYSGLAVETHDSGEYRWVRGNLQRNHERITVRGLNHNHNTDLKNLFKSAATSASTCPGPLHDPLYGSGWEWNATDDGSSDTGTQDRHDRPDDMEERSEFQPQTVAAASRLSISQEQAFHLCVFLKWWVVGFWGCSVRG
jgi:hypothetical protein